MKLLFLFLVAKTWITFVKANDFSSFLTVNASLAIILDEDYMQKRNEDLLAKVQKMVVDVARENLKDGGVNVRYFSWSGVKLKYDFIAAIIVTDCVRTWNFFEAAAENSIAVLAVTDSNCPRLPIDRAIMIPLTERGNEVPQLLLDMKIQQLLNWKSCVLLFDSSIESRSGDVIASLAHKSAHNLFNPVSVYLYQINDKLPNQQKRAYISNILAKFSNSADSNFIVFSKSVEDVIEVAANLKMFNVFNRWMFFMLSSASNNSQVFTLTQGLNEGANIAVALNKTTGGCEETVLCSITEIFTGFIFALSKVIKEETALYGQIADEEWEAIRLTKHERQDVMLAYIHEYLRGNSNCFSCSAWQFETIISWGKSGRYSSNMQRIELTEKKNYDYAKAGIWTPIFGLLKEEKLFPHSEEKFRNVSLSIATFHNPPWQILTKNIKGEIEEAKGIVIEILNEMSRRLNFTYILQDLGDPLADGVDESQNTDFSDSHTNNIPQKIYAALDSNSIFMAAIAATMDDENAGKFNYTIPISIQSYSFIARRPDEVNRVYLFTAPFTPTTWACLVAATMLVAPMLYFINLNSPLDSMQNPGLCKMKNCFWYIYGALLQQGGMYLPKADSGRVIIGVWWIVVIVIVTTYCGSLVAFLTFPKFQPGIKYLSDTFDHQEVTTFGLRNGTFFDKYAAKATRRDLVEYFKRSTPYTTLTSSDIEDVKSGARINIDWKINLQMLIQNDFDETKSCDFSLGNEDFVDEKIGLLFPVESPYLELINRELKLLKIMGFIHRWHSMYIPIVNKCDNKGKSRQITNHMVNIFDMQGCFLVLFFGFVASLAIIIVEIWIHKFFMSARRDFHLFAN